MPPARRLPAARPLPTPLFVTPQAVFTYNAKWEDGLASQVRPPRINYTRARACSPRARTLAFAPFAEPRRVKRAIDCESLAQVWAAGRGARRGPRAPRYTPAARLVARHSCSKPPRPPQPPEPPQGGYSTHIICDEFYSYRVPDNLDMAGVAPLLCAGEGAYLTLVAEPPAPDTTGSSRSSTCFGSWRIIRFGRTLAELLFRGLRAPAAGRGAALGHPRARPADVTSRPPNPTYPYLPHPKGITTYSPYKLYGLDKPGLKIGVVGLGGLVRA